MTDLGRRHPEALGRMGLVLVVAATLVALWPAQGLYFHADDFEWLRAARSAASSPSFELPEDVNGHFRPLAEAFWLLGYRLFGLEARGYHRLILALHALAAGAVGAAATRLTGSRLGGLAAGLVFGVNVAHRTVPCWISAAPDLLLGLFGAATVALLLGRGRLTRAAAVVALALAVLAKETALLLVPVMPLVAPRAFRSRALRLSVMAVAVALAVPHAVASLLSSYLRSRFQLGSHVPGVLGELLRSLLLPRPGDGGAGRPWEGAAGSAACLLVLTLLVGLASRRLGGRLSLSLAAGAVLVLLPAALAIDAVESRWLYLSWTLLAPLAGAALLEVAKLVERRAGRPGPGVVLVLALLAAHLVIQGGQMRAKIARDGRRDAWVRSVVEVAGRAPRPPAPGSRVEVVVPFGSELRGWPLGVELALERDVQLELVDDRSPVTPGVAVLDATRIPAVWRDPQASQAAP